MKRKSTFAIVLIMVAVLAIASISVLALDYSVPVNANSITSRFFFVGMDGWQCDEFSMVSEDGNLIINVTDNTIIYFEDFVPLSDECDGMTQMVREVLFGRTLSEVLEGRNMRVLYMEDTQDAVSIKIFFESFVTLPIDVDAELPTGFQVVYVDESTLERGEELVLNPPAPGEYIGIVALPETIGDYLGIVTLPDEIELGDYLGIVTLPEEIDWDEIASWDFEAVPLNGEVVVNGEIIEYAPYPFWCEYNKVVMVPLEVVVDALGYEVSLNEYLGSIQLGVGIHIWVGSTEAHRGRMAPIELSAAPVILDDVIFVPMDFFRNVLAQTTYVFEGQLVIETYSDMQ